MSRGWLQRLPNGGYDPPLECPTPTSEKNTPSKLDFSHLGAPHSTSANGSINALRDFLRVSVRTPTRKKSLRPSKSAPAYSFSPNEEVEHRRAQRAPPARWS